MDTEAKHGLPKVVALADKLARLVLDQIEKDGHINFENIRNAMMGPLARDEMDQQDYQMRLAEKHAKAREQWEGAGRILVNTGNRHVKCMCPECEAEGRYLKGVKKLAEGITENMFTPCLDRSSRVFEGVDLAKPLEGLTGPVGPIGPSAPADAIPTIDVALWGQCSDGYRFNVAATRPLLKALGNALASGKAQRVSINDGTYVMPDGEVLSEVEMIKRGGINGR